jgi:hypothetical protein
VEWTAKAIPAVDCNICVLKIEDRPDYCASCYKTITENFKLNIINKLIKLKKLQEENKEMQESTLVEAVRSREEMTRVSVSRDSTLRDVRDLKEKIHHLDQILKKGKKYPRNASD